MSFSQMECAFVVERYFTENKSCNRVRALFQEGFDANRTRHPIRVSEESSNVFVKRIRCRDELGTGGDQSLRPINETRGERRRR